jgi:NADPH-dependent ferric siderophore reductase
LRLGIVVPLSLLVDIGIIAILIGIVSGEPQHAEVSVTMSDPQPAPRQRRPRVLRTVEVRGVTQITPRVTRITLTGPGLAGFASRAPAEHIKVFLPPPGERSAPRTVPSPDGPIFPPDLPRPISRTYTPRQFRPDALELDVDFVRHGDGPGSAWAAQARPGDTVVIAGPGGGYHRPPEAAWLVIGGDETSLPAISMVLAGLPSDARADLFVEVHDRDEEQVLESAARLDVTWLHRDAPGANGIAPGGLLDAAIRAAALPNGDGQVWIACEAQAMRGIRGRLLHERGLGAAQLYTRGYWQVGEANHPDHDYGEDVS